MTYQELIEILEYSNINSKNFSKELDSLDDFTKRAEKNRVYRIPANRYTSEITKSWFNQSNFTYRDLKYFESNFLEFGLNGIRNDSLFNFEGRELFLSWVKIIMFDFLEKSFEMEESGEDKFNELNLSSYEFKLILEFYIRKSFNIETEDIKFDEGYIPNCIEKIAEIIKDDFKERFKDFEIDKRSVLFQKLILETVVWNGYGNYFYALYMCIIYLSVHYFNFNNFERYNNNDEYFDLLYSKIKRNYDEIEICFLEFRNPIVNRNDFVEEAGLKFDDYLDDSEIIVPLEKHDLELTAEVINYWSKKKSDSCADITDTPDLIFTIAFIIVIGLIPIITILSMAICTYLKII